MEVRETVQIPAKTEERVVAIMCNICGKKGRPEYPGVNWARKLYDKDETIVRWRYGTSYPESSQGSEYEIHICPTCFENKLIPWLKEQGVNPVERSWEY